MKTIAIFASGSGTNAENIIKYTTTAGCNYKVACVVYNRRQAQVKDRAAALGIPALYIAPEQWSEPATVLGLLRPFCPDAIILAGFLRMVPGYLLEAYPERILNIHPALLPSNYGGKGMYGNRVHEAVKAAGEAETGITIHVIDEDYDQGRIIFRAKVGILPTDTPADIAQKVHELEYKYYPVVIADWLSLLP